MNAEVFSRVVPPQRRRELAAEMLKLADPDAHLAPPCGRSTVIDGRAATVYNAAAIAEFCRWLLQASDHELDLLNQVEIDDVLKGIFLEKEVTHYTH
jgi:hypothetical protein